jgi:hypothetical protein
VTILAAADAFRKHVRDINLCTKQLDTARWKCGQGLKGCYTNKFILQRMYVDVTGLASMIAAEKAHSQVF